MQSPLFDIREVLENKRHPDHGVGQILRPYLRKRKRIIEPHHQHYCAVF